MSDAKLKIIHLINKYYKLYNINTRLIYNTITNHNKYLYLMNNIKIVIIYKWNIFKEEYKYIKFKVKQNNQLYYDIIKIYNNMINYYNLNESQFIQNKIHDIYNKKNNIIIKLKKLLIIHKDVCYNHNLLIKSKKNIIIDSYSYFIDNVINELYNNIKNVNRARYILNRARHDFYSINNQLLFFTKN